MNINIHAGHNPDGRTACGAAGILRESTEARRVKDEVIRRLRQLGHTVYDCTCDNGTDQTDVLKKIVAACNAHTVDLDVSIHFNSGAGDPAGNGATTGTEAWIYSAAGRAKKYAENICQAISAAGYRNRGVKVNPKLYVLRHTKAPAVLVECCFVDDRDDAARYNCQEMAAAIVYGITGQRLTETDPGTDETHPGQTEAPGTPQIPTGPDTPAVPSGPQAPAGPGTPAVPSGPQAPAGSGGPGASGQETPSGDSGTLYRVQVIRQYGAFTSRTNAERLCAKLRAEGIDAVII